MLPLSSGFIMSTVEGGQYRHLCPPGVLEETLKEGIRADTDTKKRKMDGY
jgi:hypothetical protein